MRRHALREEIRRVRGTIRAMRDAAPRRPPDVSDDNVFSSFNAGRGGHEGGDENMDMDGAYGGQDVKWRFGAS